MRTHKQTRIFDGKPYFFNSNYDTKGEAERQAKFLRKRGRQTSKGTTARVVHRVINKRVFYSVFWRQYGHRRYRGK